MREVECSLVICLSVEVVEIVHLWVVEACLNWSDGLCVNFIVRNRANDKRRGCLSKSRCSRQ
jgi:hypothetical protein